jgi:acetolactate synthase-1/2/3 large subunit
MVVLELAKRHSLTLSLLLIAIFYLGKKFPFFFPIRKKVRETIQIDSEVNHGGNLVAQVLRNHGVKFLFTLSGGHISPILVGAKQLGIRVVDTRHEVTAAFAADAISRTTGVPGVACVTAGPGLTNTVTAIKNAQMAQSPLILLGGATSDLLKGKGSLQDIDQVALLKPHVKWLAHVKSISEIVPTLEKAFHTSQSGTPGPVFVELPVDVLYPEKVVREWYAKETGKMKSITGKLTALYINHHIGRIFNTKRITFHEPLRLVAPLPSRWQISKVISILRKAKKPVLVVGSQACFLPAANKNIQNGATLQASVQYLRLPTYLSGSARGLLGKDSSIGLRHTRSTALRNADVILLVGVVCDFRLDYGRTLSRNAYIIGVNRDEIDLHKNKSPNLAIFADPATFLHRLADAFPQEIATQWPEWLAQLKEADAKRDAEIQRDALTKVEPMNPVRVCQVIEECVDENSVLVADGGDFVGTASYVVRPRAPLTWLDPGPFGTLGVGGGFALGAKLARPDAEVWIIFGDGACGYSLSEFDTYVRHNLPVIAVVGNDAAWQQILRGQVETFKDDVGCALAFTDYHTVVTGFGAQGLKIEQEESLQAQLQKAKQYYRKGQPVLVNCLLGKCDFRKGSIAI